MCSVRSVTYVLGRSITGVDAHGADFQEKAYTENVSLSGFLCSCVTALRMNSEVEVYLMEPADSTLERPMQSARNRR